MTEINNIANIAFNSAGLLNAAFGGGAMGFDSDNLTFSYRDGSLSKLIGKFAEATGAYALMGSSSGINSYYFHELGHIWQSRSLNDLYLLNYFSGSIFPFLMNKGLHDKNYFEDQANNYWR